MQKAMLIGYFVTLMPRRPTIISNSSRVLHPGGDPERYPKTGIEYTSFFDFAKLNHKKTFITSLYYIGKGESDLTGYVEH